MYLRESKIIINKLKKKHENHCLLDSIADRGI